MITCHDLNHSYDGSTPVLAEVSTDVPRGKLTALIGPNGAGKSTLLSAIARLLSPDTGHVLVDDVAVATAPADQVARLISVLRQDNHLTARLTVVDLVRFGRFPYSRGRLRAEDHRAVEQALDYVGLEDLRDRYLDQLSGGQRQRAFLAMVLAQDTDYILLDEPLNNLDMKHATHTMGLLRRAVDEFGKTVVVVLHDINFASAYADHIVAMRDARIVATGGPDRIMQRSVLQQVFDMDIHVQDLNGMRLGIFWTPGAPVPAGPVAAPRNASDTLDPQETLMRTLVADVATDAPARYAKQLASHLGRKMTVTDTDRGPFLEASFENGGASCLMETTRPDVLHLRVEADEEADADRMARVVGSHLERFGARAGLVVEWDGAAAQS